MRQGDGSELLGANDPRSQDIGVIYVAPNDDRRDVLTAIITQEKLGRREIAIVLPEQNKAFQRPVDFDGLKGMRRGLKAQIVFVAPPGPGPAEFARQRRFPVFSSLENFSRSLQENGPVEGQKRGWRFPLGGRRPVRRSAPGASQPEAAPAFNPPPAARLAPGDIVDADVVDPHAHRADNEPPEPEHEHEGGTAAAAAAGAAAGLGLAALSQRPPTSPGAFTVEDDDEEDLPPATGAGPASIPVSPAAHNRPADDEEADDADAEDDDDDDGLVGAAAGGAAAGAGAEMASRAGAAPGNSGPGIIQFPPSRRITQKLTAADPAAANAPESAPAPRRNSGKMAAVAGAGAGAAAGAALANRGGATAAPPFTPTRRVGGPGGPPPRRRTRWPLLVGLLILLLVLLMGGCGVLAYAYPSALGPVAKMLPFGAVTATVSITPDSSDLKNQYLITGVTGTPNAGQREIQARQLTATPPSQTKSAQATGKGHTAGVSARGSISFTQAVASRQTVGSGTVFTIRGLNVVTDEAAVLPPASPSNPVTVTVRAHVVQPGSAGNLPAGAMSNRPCCFADGSVFATSNAFTGGQDPESFTFVQQSDIDHLANPLKASLQQQAQQQFQGEVQPNEKLIGEPQCKANVKSDHKAGDHASSVTVTVSATCTGETYDQKAALNMGADLLRQEAQQRPGAGYALSGQLVTSVSDIMVIDQKSGKLSITVNAEGVWVYQFNDAQKQALAHLIAGKSKQDAIRLLLQQKGVRQADIQISHGDGNTLPGDPSQITINVLAVPGVAPTPTAPAGSPTSAPGSATPRVSPSPTGGNNLTPTPGLGSSNS